MLRKDKENTSETQRKHKEIREIPGKYKEYGRETHGIYKEVQGKYK